MGIFRARAGVLLATAFAALTFMGGCGGGTTSSGGPLTIATFNPFSGADSFFGPNEIAGCFAAARLIDQAGGILGHKTLRCRPVDSRGVRRLANEQLLAPAIMINDVWVVNYDDI